MDSKGTQGHEWTTSTNRFSAPPKVAADASRVLFCTSAVSRLHTAPSSPRDALQRASRPLIIVFRPFQLTPHKRRGEKGLKESGGDEGREELHVLVWFRHSPFPSSSSCPMFVSTRTSQRPFSATGNPSNPQPPPLSLGMDAATICL